MLEKEMAEDIYSRLGVDRVINCATTYTRLGGSIMSPTVAQAMADAADAYVSIPELQEAIGKRIAQLTGNEAAYVSNGAAAGIALAAAACMARKDDQVAMSRLPHDAASLKNEFIIQRNQRNYYDASITLVGGRIVEVGHAMETALWEFDAAYSEKTAGVFYFAGSHLNHQTLSLSTVVEWAHARGLPVIVDAAAQIPPISSLWHFTRELDADLALFSGGKGLAGPQNSGLIVGRAELIRAIEQNGPPHHNVGRPMKTAKEAMVGLLTAVEEALDPDREGERQATERAWWAQLETWSATWSANAGDGIGISIDPTGEAGEPVPRILIRFGAGSPLDLDTFVEALQAEHPRIEVVIDDPVTAAVSAHLLRDGEAEIVEQRIASILQGEARYAGQELVSVENQ